MTQLDIITVLKQNKRPMSALEISNRTGLERHRVLKGLRRLVKFKAIVPLFISFRNTQFKLRRGL